MNKKCLDNPPNGLAICRFKKCPASMHRRGLAFFLFSFLPDGIFCIDGEFPLCRRSTLGNISLCSCSGPPEQQSMLWSLRFWAIRHGNLYSLSQTYKTAAGASGPLCCRYLFYSASFPCASAIGRRSYTILLPLRRRYPGISISGGLLAALSRLFEH